MSSTEGDPKPPVRYAHAAPEGEELKQWKTSVLAMIDKRIDLYPLPRSKALPARISRTLFSLLTRMRRSWRSLLHLLRSKFEWLRWGKALEQDQRAISLDLDRIVTATERVGHIPELVENILRFADPATQIPSAWNTSFAWRQTVAHILSTSGGDGSFRGTYPCGAIESGQTITPDFALVGLNPTPEEIQILQRDVALSLKYLRPLRDVGDESLHHTNVPRFSTRVRCSTLLPRPTIDLYNELRDCSNLSQGCAAGVQTWYDFSQLQINPYFQAVFRDVFSYDQENIDIRLRSQSSVNNLLFPGARPSAMLDAIQSLQLTEPPCKAVDICVETPQWTNDSWRAHVSREPANIRHEATNRYVGRINKMINKDGVTCGQVIEVLEGRAQDCLGHWKSCASKLRREIATMEDCLDLWYLSGAPTFVLRLGRDDANFEEWQKEVDKYHTMLSSPAIERQLEWMPMEMVRVGEYTEIRDGKIYHYPADLEH